MNELLSPPSEDDVFQAEQAVVAATAGLIAAEAQRAELDAPADPGDIFQAEQAVAAARAGLTAAQSSLNDLLGGVDPSDLYQAEQALSAALANRDAAEARLSELLQPPTDDDILEAQLALASAESSLREAQARHDELLTGPTATTIAQQEQNVRLAEISYEQALAAMDDLVIEAPFDGVVEEVNVQPGDRIGAGLTAFVVSTRDQIVVELTVTHRGRQRVAILRLDDQDANTIVELRSDSVYDEVWARDNRSVPYLSGIEGGDEWLRTTIRLAAGRVGLSTCGRDANAGDGSEAPWATVVPDETYARHSALAAIVVALGDAGGFHVDDITIDVTTTRGGAR